jgi:putative transposase
MWKALVRAGEPVGRDRVKRLMRAEGLQGAKRRGRPWRTTRPDIDARRRPDLVQRNFAAQVPDRLWVADISYLRCWEGLVFFAFVLEVLSDEVCVVVVTDSALVAGKDTDDHQDRLL